MPQYTTDDLPLSDAEYAADEDNRCPFCLSTEVEGGPFDVNGKQARQEMECQSCYRTWDDVYKLVAYA